MTFPSVYEMTNSLTPVTQSSTKTYDQQADGDFVDIWNTNPYIAINPAVVMNMALLKPS